MKLEINEQSTCINKTKYDTSCSTTYNLTLYNTGDWTHDLHDTLGDLFLINIDKNVDIRDSSAKISFDFHQNRT